MYMLSVSRPTKRWKVQANEGAPVQFTGIVGQGYIPMVVDMVPLFCQNGHVNVSIFSFPNLRTKKTIKYAISAFFS